MGARSSLPCSCLTKHHRRSIKFPPSQEVSSFLIVVQGGCGSYCLLGYMEVCVCVGGSSWVQERGSEGGLLGVVCCLTLFSSVLNM